MTGIITNLVIGPGIAFGLKFLPGVPGLEPAWADCSVDGRPVAFWSLLFRSHGAQPGWLLYIMQFLIAFAVTSVGLALLNLIPLYPLDGYYILFAILPSGPAITYRNAIQYMELILLLILFLIPYLLQILRFLLIPPDHCQSRAVAGLHCGQSRVRLLSRVIGAQPYEQTRSPPRDAAT